MKINAITSYSSIKQQSKKHEVQKQQNYNSNPINLNNGSNPAYFNINFSGAYEKENKKKFNDAISNFTPFAHKIYTGSIDIAKEFHHKEITHDHIFLKSLRDMLEHVESVDNGTINPSNSNFAIPRYIGETISIPSYLEQEEDRQKVKKVVLDHIEKTENKLAQSSIPSKRASRPEFSSETLADINYMYDLSSEQYGDTFADALFLGAMCNAQDVKTQDQFDDFIFDLQKELMIKEAPEEKKTHLQFFDEKADTIWKNINAGNNVYITYDGENRNNTEHLFSSFVNLIKKPGQVYSNINKENIEIVSFNNNATLDFVKKFAKENAKKSNKEFIYIINFAHLVGTTNQARGVQSSTFSMYEDDLDFLANKKSYSKNMRNILVSDTDMYLAAQKANGIYVNKFLDQYNKLSLPIVNAKEAKEILNSDTGLTYIKAETQKDFSGDAINRIIEITNQADGYYPEKAMQMMKKVASQYFEKDKISIDDVQKYEEESLGIKKVNETNEDYKIVFDTKKTLNDIVGTPMTKAEAKSVVDLITRGGQKGITRGYTTYLSNGSSYGGGRRHSAEAIAGEAQIPMITINARDFALKDIDALSQNANLSEMKIKKIINAAKTQAETNKNKTAMIFIENFDNFGSDPLYGISSIYEQKAFSQLLTEMENVRKNDDVSIIVIGSTNRPELLDENIMKPYKFLDQIIVYSPQDKRDRKDIINYYINKMDLKIAGDTSRETAKIIENVAETTSYFSVVDLIYLLEKADDISKQRGKDAIDKADFTEAFLQTTTGRVNTAYSPEHEKKLVAAHECGHALALQLMYDIASKQEKPWHLPDKVNFVTLDPRGTYGGAMYPKSSDNGEYSFEKVFSELVCYFGGHASEKHFYNMDGSWGITQDMAMATNMAKSAVQLMGMGPKTGRISVGQNGLGLTDASDSLKEKMDADVEVMLKNAEFVSNKIIRTYQDFVEEFADKYKDKVGTGECIIMSDEFNQMLYDWKNNLSSEDLDYINSIEEEILEVIEKTKKGQLAK